MASFCIAGSAADVRFTFCERLGDIIGRALPDARVLKVLAHPGEWTEQRAEICRVLGAGPAGDGPMVWTLTGRLVGDERAFATLAKERYGIASDMSEPELEEVTRENLQFVQDRRKHTRLREEHTAPRALIIVDVQNDFCEGGSLEVPDGNAVIPVINAMRRDVEWDLIVLTQDFHPADHVSFASNNPGRKLFEKVEELGGQVMWPDHCVQGSLGAEFHPGLHRAASDVVVQKGKNRAVDSYSGFGDASGGRMEKTELEDVLRSRGIVEVFAAGLATDYCVAFTCQDAAKAGFRTFMVEDASRGIAKESIEEARQRLEELGVSLVTSTELPKKAAWFENEVPSLEAVWQEMRGSKARA